MTAPNWELYDVWHPSRSNPGPFPFRAATPVAAALAYTDKWYGPVIAFDDVVPENHYHLRVEWNVRDETGRIVCKAHALFNLKPKGAP